MNKMNSKGQIAVGTFILLFVGLIVALPLLQNSAQNVGQISNKESVTNQSLVIPATLNTTVYLRGQIVENFNVTNSTGSLISAANYTVSNQIIGTDGIVGSSIKFMVNGYNGSTVKANYLSTPSTYATDSSTRAVSDLIIVLAALALLAFVLYYVYENGGEIFG